MKRIFINNYNFKNDWIMGKISLDIKTVAQSMGYQCRIGTIEDYEGEEICYHMAFHIAVPIPQAEHNSVFFTHLNDSLQEINLMSIKNKFDSFICMSPEDAQYLIEIGFNPDKVFGRTLPVRNNYIRPLSVGIFSACYPDGRKNEQWLLDFCKSSEDAKLLNFVFIGDGWCNVVEKLHKLDCSYEWHNVSRSLPYEYEFQQLKLSELNYYIYMGMDGGAMGTYDAYAQGVPLCVTYDGFHKSIPEIDFVFDNKQTFFESLSKIANKQANRISFFKQNTSKMYVDWLIKVWHGGYKEEISMRDIECLSYNSVSEKKRSQYYPINIGRIRVHIGKYLKKIILSMKVQKE